MRTLILFIGTLFLVTSCQKVIQLDLNNAEQQYVVDAMVSNQPNYNYVILTKSAKFYDSNVFTPVEGAVVTFTDENGNVISLTETSSGYYENPSFTGLSYTNYSLKIEVNGEVIEGTTYLPGYASFDSIPTVESQGGFFGEGFTAFAYWSDNGSEKNYYRIRTFENGKKEKAIYISEDNLYNGISTGVPLFSNSYELNDTAVIQLMSIDEKTYKYWYSLDQISSPQNQPAAPGNPISNLSKGTLGYFGGYNMDIDTLVIQ